MRIKHAKYGLLLAALLLAGACNRSDTNMTEAFWCSSYGTCKPSGVAAAQVQPASAAPAAYDACAFYGICDRGSL